MKSHLPASLQRGLYRLFQSSKTKRAAFTLIELLAVMAIMIIMLALLIPSIVGIKGANDLTKAAYGLADTLTQARAYAMANNTYVFVGIAETDVSKPDSLIPQVAGTGRLAVIAVASRDGNRHYDINNAKTSWTANYANGINLVALNKLQHWENIHFAASLTAPPTSGNMARASVSGANLMGSSGAVSVTPISWPLGSALNPTAGQYYFTKVLMFDPRGTPSMQTANVNGINLGEWWEIGLQQSQGNITPPPPASSSIGNQVAIQINGMTGAIRIFRP